ncbi:hypothetical protein DKK68_06350 [Bifidobacterium asteroides]|uniref:hypothetical protein n=1 Tax=Bifidobacterium asteroides TaxID=1684 RepID=UPI000D78C53C|nr:hypothetical protein [Bifidobacterium asteroides]PXY87376.1 hypothetical protein DKK68_06350 [Bifidobacterium asteroides]
MSYKATNISKPPLNPWAPDDNHIDHVSKPDESRWKNAKTTPQTLPQADTILKALSFEEDYYRQQRKLGHEVGILLNGISEFFRGFRMSRECQQEANASEASVKVAKS